MMELLKRNIESRSYTLKALTLCVLCMYGLLANAQDFHFTQFAANKLYLSPSFAGATAQNRFIAGYRNQWPAVNGYTSYVASFDHYFSRFNSGIGFLVMRDVAGDGQMGITNFALSYSYDLALTPEVHVRPGLSFSYRQGSVDFSKLVFSSQISSTGISAPTTEGLGGKDQGGAPDAAVSTIAYARDWWLGATVDHLMRPNLSFVGNNDALPLKTAVFGGLTIIRKGRLLKPVDETLSVAFLFQQMQRNMQTDIGLYWAKIPLTFGLWYRGIPWFNTKGAGDMFALLLGLKMAHLGIAYSYDFTVSGLVNRVAGAHEVTLSYEFSRAHKKKLTAVPCPEF
jgi:type IX secretion system PorP/SprF family membrane protein